MQKLKHSRDHDIDTSPETNIPSHHSQSNVSPEFEMASKSLRTSSPSIPSPASSPPPIEPFSKSQTPVPPIRISTSIELDNSLAEEGAVVVKKGILRKPGKLRQSAWKKRMYILTTSASSSLLTRFDPPTT